MTRRPRSPEQQWAPFPVQDWHRHARSAAWRRTRHTPRPALVVTAAMITLFAALLFWADLPARTTTATGAPLHPWLPVDGSNLAVTVSRDDTQLPASLGAAILATPGATQSVPNGLGTLLLGATELELDRTIWRSTLALADHDEFQLWNASGQIRLLATSHPEPRGFVGGVLVLDRAPLAGQTWQSSGTTVEPVVLDGEPNEAQPMPWRASFTSSAVEDPTCLAVDGLLEVQGETPQSLAFTWCRGRGPVEMSWGHTRITHAERATSLPETAEPRLTPLPDPTEWLTTVRTPVTVLPRIGAEPMVGSPGLVLHETTSRKVVMSAGSDVLVLDPIDQLLVTRHRLHPGGRLVAVEVFGDLVLAATDARHLVAFDTVTGVELWRRNLPDTTAATLPRIDDRTAAVPLANGALWAVDLRDGSSRWESPLLMSAQPPVATAPGLVLTLSPGAEVVALDADTGEPRWRQRPDAAVIDTVAVGGGLAWVFTDEGMSVHDLASGDLTGRGRAAPGAQIRTVAGQPLVWVPDAELRAVAPDGTSPWRDRLACEEVVVQADRLICWSSDRVLAVDSAGRHLTQQPIIDHVVGQLQAAATADGVMWRVNRTPGTDGPTSWEVYTWHR